MKMKPAIGILALFASLSSASQPAQQAIKEGNDLYRLEKYPEATERYNKAIRLDPANKIATFNLANALFRQGKQNDAIGTFRNLSTELKDKDFRSKTFYNEGVVLTIEKKLEESIEAYKNALRQNPNDKDARENLQKALLELKKKNPPKKEDDKKKKQPQQQKQPQPQPKMDRREAEQRLKLLEQKEKQVQQRMKSDQKSSTGAKDW